MVKIACEIVRIGGWPLIYNSINPLLLGSNDIHCVVFSWDVGKRLLNLNLGESLVLLETLHCLAYGGLSRASCWRGWNLLTIMKTTCKRNICALLQYFQSYSTR
jgi:hypothetical protein